MNEKYKIVAIGSGFGGLQCVIQGALRGARCALIEKTEIGGECLNFGCIPTKTMAHSMDVYRTVRSAPTMGIEIGGEVKLNFSRTMARQKAVVNEIVDYAYQVLADMGIDFYEGVGTIIKPNKVRVQLSKLQPGQKNEIFLETENIVIGTGSFPHRLSIPGGDLPGVLTNREIFNLKSLPKSMVVIGCSYVGVEFGTIFANMGTKVTMLGRKNFLKDFDQKLARNLRHMIAGQQGVHTEIGLEILEIQKSEGGFYKVVFEKDGQERWAQGEVVLMATGRVPYTEDLFQGDVKIVMDGPAVAVSDYLETSVPGIYAVGDVLNQAMLAFSAAREGEVAADNCLGKRIRLHHTVVPRCVFAYPQLAGVGMKEEEAQLTEGLHFEIAEYPFETTPMAQIMNQTEGMTRLIFEKGSGKILGGHILGPHASELIAEISLAVHEGLSVKDLAHLLHFHPSLSENIKHAGEVALLMEQMGNEGFRSGSLN